MGLFSVFQESLYYTQKGENGTILDPKSAFLNFSVNLSSSILFQKCTWWQAVKRGLRWLFKIFNKNSYAQIWINGTYLGSEPTL